MSLQAYDPPVINAFHQCDPAAHVWKHDPNIVYVYGSHDWNSTRQPPVQYDMKDYYVLTQTDYTKPAVVGPKLLDLTDIPWASQQLWAPDAAYSEATNMYYLFFPAKDKEGVFRIGVATSDKPDGKFKAEPNPIAGTYSIDPTILEDNGNYYMVFGGLWGGQLQAWNNNVLNESLFGNNAPTSGPALGPRFAKLSANLTALAAPPKELVIYDQDGKVMQADSPRRYFEAPSLNKVGGLYVLQYSTGTSHTIEIAVGHKPDGPFYWKNTLLQPVKGWTTHESIVNFKGDWLLYYADSSLSGRDDLRNTKVRKLLFQNGTFELAQPQPVVTQ
ncbi:glycoside hydrolase family 43 protein [Exserohilum turcica Et28A]|uniref:Glycoside hydrolase family 43 protein n=1 Tax=Exserohilum turcicum (strain 28A) TaxID=671987 RepID=R0JXX5_EXST2|nr:glycoside hydrolase family 43 protein [Exserohilum turcica Et28A]EOA82349.1 glycoside hydrolase family 43 protein [Exserohilum turcica Et28A]